jgi:hypothetical protein
MTKAARAAYWITPLAFCTILYWYGLKAWFLQDDFAWLGLQDEATNFASLLRTLFVPLAQGTIRPWSERAFFLIFSSLFGLHAFPFRLFVFLNQFLNLILVAILARKLIGAAPAGIAAPLLWLSNMALVIPMAWSAAYNEVQFATFFLAGIYLFVRYTETGDRKFYIAQWITFLFAFGSLELNVVYPAVVAVYSFACARRYFRSTLPLFAASIAYSAIHRMAAGPTQSYYYQTIIDPSILSTFGKYWAMLFGLTKPDDAGLSAWSATLLAALTIAIAGFVVQQARRQNFLPLVFLCWYLITLTPFLLISRHITTYYQAIPAIPMAMLGALALVTAWRSGWVWRIVTVGAISAYAVPSISAAAEGMQFYYARSQRIRHLIESVAYAEKLHPGKAILLRDIDDQLFWDGVRDSPFRLFGWTNVFVAPECRLQIHNDSHFEPLDKYFLPATPLLDLLKRDQIVVYSAEGTPLRNITRQYAENAFTHPAPEELAAQLDLGLPYLEVQLGEGWYRAEQEYRWMGRHAVLYLPGPDRAGQKLFLHGAFVDQQRSQGPLHLAVTIDGRPAQAHSIGPSQREFRFEYDLASDLIGKAKIEIGLTVDRTFRAGRDERELGALFKEAGLR